MPDGLPQTAPLRRIDLTGFTPTTPDAGPAPVLQWLPIDCLRIDDSYQRGLSGIGRKTIQRIAAGFDWALFGAVVVAPLPGGLYAIIDGQHRTHAAALAGIDSVPALIQPIPRDRQASAFVGLNTVRVGVSPYHVLKAALAGGEGWALDLDRTVTAAGCRLMTYHQSGKQRQPRQLQCITALRDAQKRPMGLPVIGAVLGALADYDTTGRVALWDRYIVVPLLRAALAIPCGDRDRIARALAIRDPFLAMESARAKAAAERIPASVAAVAIFRAMIEGAGTTRKDDE